MMTWPSSGIVHNVKTVELLLEPDVVLPLRRTVDEPRPARNAKMRTRTMTIVIDSFFTLHVSWLGWIYAYS